MATYYVDATGGSDAAAGTSEGAAWQTISKVNGETFSAGDSVLFKRGEVWREQLTVPSSGASGNPITFGAYGSGALPVVNGADIYDENDWTAVPATASSTTYPAASLDDAYVYAGSVFVGNQTYLIAGNISGNSYETGVRFKNVTVPNGATITSAFIRFTAAFSNGGNCNLIIRGQDNDEPAIFSTYADFAGRSRTTASVAWNSVPSFTDGTTYDTPDISSIVTEIVALGGWASGDDMVVFLADNSSDANARRAFSAYDDSAGAEAAELHISYSTGVTNVYTLDSPVGDGVGVVVAVDGTLATQVSSEGALSADYDYWVDTGESPNVIHLYTETAPSAATIEVSSRLYGVEVNAKQYVTVRDLEVRYAAYAGVRMTGAVTGSCVVDGVTATRNRIFGIVAIGGHDGDTIQNCTTTYNGNGIYSSSADDTQILNNVSHDNIHHAVAPTTDGDGIGVFDSDGVTVSGNQSYDNPGGDGIDVDGNSSASSITVTRNVTYGNGSGSEAYGINIGGMVGTVGQVVVAANIAWGNNTSGTHAEYAINGPATFINNSAYTAGGASGSIGTLFLTGTITARNNVGRVGGGVAQRAVKVFAGATLTADYNLWHTEAGGDMSVIGSTASTWAEWQSGGYDANGVNSDPAFVDEDGTTSADFKLTEGSPAIGAGTDVSLATDYFGFTYRDPPDIGAHSYTGENSRRGGLPGHRAPWIGVGIGV